MVYDMLVMNKWQEKNGDEKINFRAVGVAFEAKTGDGGLNCEPFGGIAISGPFIIRKRKGKNARAETGDTGDDFLE